MPPASVQAHVAGAKTKWTARKLQQATSQKPDATPKHWNDCKAPLQEAKIGDAPEQFKSRHV